MCSSIFVSRAKALRLWHSVYELCRRELLVEMAPIRYSLHYEDYSEHLMSRFGKLLQMQSMVDMTLMCSSHTLRVHKAVLAASSAYFQEVLQKQTGEPLIILKMSFNVLKSLVEFMYCGKTQCLEENLDELVSAAQFLKIKGLSKVTKEGLGITNDSEIVVFTPPVVISKPPQSLIDLHAQEADTKSQQSSQLAPVTSTSQPVDNLNRTNKDMVVRIPFDIENSNTTNPVDYVETPRVIKPRRGRPSVRRPNPWEGSASLGRAAERALLRREQDSRKAIHQLKHLQTRHIQDYMDRVSLSQAVNSICGPESSSNYLDIDNDLMYMDQTVSSNMLDPTIAFTKEHSIANEAVSTYANNNITSSANETSTSGISTAMSQYVNALKNAGLPTDLPILFESGDGSYINVNEQVLLDMVQSSEIQYEVIEQPNIIEKVADPSEIKSIDDLSKSIERGEILLGGNDYDKNSTQYHRAQDTINSLNAILPDNLESFEEQQTYVDLDTRLQDNNPHDFSCIDGDMQFFTKSMSDDVKKYYVDHQMDNNLDTNFSISLLDNKSSQELDSNLSQQYNSLNPVDIRRNDDCYDFGLQLPRSEVFKEDALDCLMDTPKGNDDAQNNHDGSNQLDDRAQERDEIIKDLMNIENNMNVARNYTQPNNTNSHMFDESNNITALNTPNISTSGLQWNNLDTNNKDDETEVDCGNTGLNIESQMNTDPQNQESVIDLTNSINDKPDTNWADIINENADLDKENVKPNEEYINSDLHNDIPFAVGLLPLKRVQPSEGERLLKRKHSTENDLLDTVDAKCLKRKTKYK